MLDAPPFIEPILICAFPLSAKASPELEKNSIKTITNKSLIFFNKTTIF